MTVESTLSEILSPVDEVLSYGSAELPPLVKGGARSGLDSYSYPPPPPAFEIITWTSEEELAAPPDCEEDLSINSENIPPLPVDLSHRRRESQSLASNSLRAKEVNNDDLNGDLCKTLPLALSICEDMENDCSLSEDRNEISDPFSSFQIGDRVLVCNSRPGVLKYKGLTAFGDGFWAGVALDTPNGNHNGTFRGVKYFHCHKSHGVLVRAEDISYIHREHGSDIDTGVDEDPFSDEEPPSAQKDRKQKDTSSTGGQGGHTNSQCPPRDDSIMPKNSPQKEPQGDMLDGARDLSHPSEMPSPKDIRNGEERYFMPCLLEQWHQAQPDLPPKIKVPPHEDGIIYRLVDAAMEILCGQANYNAFEFYETPSYLYDDDSRKRYRQVIFQLTSDVLHEVLGDLLRTKQPAQITDNESVISALKSRKISVTFLKIQELHNEKRAWLDYRSDQDTVKMRLTEEIFSLLLDDTILVLNHMHF
ncbi:uncharacterized protein LOC127439624 isoform X2 [Myxocyprinus asiaticus]|uniref:uncharacterized protein LOC127439624 isoform X2 n=1 Tax=Myxocyprinus asiaticus TaxID=70543 RepID=UPI002223E57A|nr:uncharacterized protein LOC127439624 isoform X2 [Myxocyprinus asiaticus]